MILQSTQTIKHFQMVMEINCKGMSSVTIPDPAYKTLLLQSLTGTAEDKCCRYLCDCRKSIIKVAGVVTSVVHQRESQLVHIWSLKRCLQYRCIKELNGYLGAYAYCTQQKGSCTRFYLVLDASAIK